MRNLNKTKILNAAIDLANEIRIALLKEKGEYKALYNDILEGCCGKDFLGLAKCQLNIRKKYKQLDDTIEQVTKLEDMLCQYYHNDSYSDFYRRALENMHTMEAVYSHQTGYTFS